MLEHFRQMAFVRGCKIEEGAAVTLTYLIALFYICLNCIIPSWRGRSRTRHHKVCTIPNLFSIRPPQMNILVELMLRCKIIVLTFCWEDENSNCRKQWKWCPIHIHSALECIIQSRLPLRQGFERHQQAL